MKLFFINGETHEKHMKYIKTANAEDYPHLNILDIFIF